MTPRARTATRLGQVLGLVAREDEHLQAVRERFLGDDCHIDPSRLQALLATDTGVDRLESFGAKFARMQDSVVDKLVPLALEVLGEPIQAAIDNLGRMERLNLVVSADAWLEMRGLRNRLVHEYIDRPADLAQALQQACRFSARMHEDFLTIRAAAAPYAA